MAREFLGVPLKDLATCVFLTSVITIAIFLPAIENFGKVLFGQHDMNLFLWVFWHFENSIKNWENPFFAHEIFYPYGISLSQSTTAPFQGVIYALLPDSWGPFGKVTALQVLSFLLGGFFSFILVYRFTQSAIPSLVGSLIFDFSPFHFEKALIAPNYCMAMPFVAMFFVFYYDAAGRTGRNAGTLAALSLSLLLIALNELTVAIMAGFIVFIDIFRRYMAASRRPIVTYQNCAVALVASIFSTGLFVFLIEADSPAMVTYLLPPLVFLSAVAFLILGAENVVKSEKREGLLKALALCALPAVIYILALAAQPGYKFAEEDWADRLRFYSKPVEYVLFPSNLQEISKTIGMDGLGGLTNAGVYIGPVLLLLLLLSYVLPGAGGEESYFKNMFLVCLFFSFPLLVTRTEILTPTPFLAQPLFPMMGVLREPARFMLFGLLFLAVATGILIKRIAEPGGSIGRLAGLALIALLIAERWPSMGSFQFDATVPEFYKSLAGEPRTSTLLLANFNYEDLLRESYYQTVHGKKLSYGLVSRFPSEGPLASLGTPEITGGQAMDAGSIVGLAEDYDYVVLHKAKNDSFGGMRQAIEARYPRVYDDAFMSVYKTG
ncbi:MAG TPA: hypothetical protein VLD37_06630 [Candidatus Bilamarchaeum sp.]|nr:hypothetical protein [Candidatus Bilamarchaeum sp.]